MIARSLAVLTLACALVAPMATNSAAAAIANRLIMGLFLVSCVV